MGKKWYVMIKKIGILTSGGDAPGMNTAIRSIARSALKKGIKVMVIHEGFKGLVEDKIFDAKRGTFANIVNSGGSFIKSARLPEFAQLKVRKKAHENLKKHNIDALVIVGGDGSYHGALKLTNEGFPCIGLPGTIDNDIALTDYTIGFDTALNSIIRYIDQVRNTMFSHSSCFIFEVMGRYCGDLALYSSFAVGADILSISEDPLSEEGIILKIQKEQKLNKDNFIILVSEKLYNVHNLAHKIEKRTNIITRASILGHFQRGGRPSSFDRILATKLGYEAIELLLKGEKGVALGIEENKITYHPIEKVLKTKIKFKKKILDIFNATK